MSPAYCRLAASFAVLFFLAGVCQAQAPSVTEAYWPGWLGPKRDGWVEGFQAPKSWPRKLKRGWRVKVGVGYGSPLVADGRVWQHARQGEEEAVWCFDLETGTLKWRRSYPAPFKIGGGGERHGKGPKSCPVLADGRLFTLSISGILTAWDSASGKQLCGISGINACLSNNGTHFSRRFWCRNI